MNRETEDPDVVREYLKKKTALYSVGKPKIKG